MSEYNFINLILFAFFCLIGGFLGGLLIGREIGTKKTLKNVGESEAVARWKDLSERERERIDMAQFYYNKDWFRVLTICDDVHLGGDCVLCGGESV